MAKLTHEEFDKNVAEALAGVEKSLKAKGSARTALASVTQRMEQSARSRIPALRRGQQ